MTVLNIKGFIVLLYIDLTDDIETPQYCWTEDDVGRVVMIIGNKLLFQRMVNGQTLMYGELDGRRSSFNDQVNKEMLQNRSNKLNL